MLERALFALRLGGSTNSGPSSNQVEHLRRLDDPEDNAEDDLGWLDLRYVDDGEDDDESEDDLAIVWSSRGLPRRSWAGIMSRRGQRSCTGNCPVSELHTDGHEDPGVRGPFQVSRQVTVGGRFMKHETNLIVLH